MSADARIDTAQKGLATPATRWAPRIGARRIVGAIWHAVFFAATATGIALLGMLIWSIVEPGWDWVSWRILTNMPSRRPELSGMNSGIWGSIWIVVGASIFSFVIGVGSAIYLEEYAPRNRLNRILQTNISNLSGVPSVVYGLLGLVFFVQWLSLGRSLAAGALTMGLLILPVVVISSQEAIRAVPLGLRQAAYGLGATRWQTVRHHVLPAAMPGILTGMILSMSRAIGETAPLIVVGASSLVLTRPDGPLSAFTAMPVQIFNWSSRPQEDFEHLAAAAIIVLMIVLLTMNATAILLRQRLSKRNRW
ncbi:MAG: Phosphate transport system permease protein PstA [uncultured Thermomicrobiales bacterium]|uniref:Phosphate transport system permease protein PstA n=1 Tax=uncultured Thermomicrobiales bacterium TaxID=1645740 RepID=A0A6J4UL67_9BACT|nr:MAG: Phosphate transport system permease protein PstA [uncultured Thermomicrobiales bacterium]